MGTHALAASLPAKPRTRSSPNPNQVTERTNNNRPGTRSKQASKHEQKPYLSSPEAAGRRMRRRSSSAARRRPGRPRAHPIPIRLLESQPTGSRSQREGSEGQGEREGEVQVPVPEVRGRKEKGTGAGPESAHHVAGARGSWRRPIPARPLPPDFFSPFPSCPPPGPRDRTRPEVSILFLSFLSRGVFRRRQYFSHCLGVIGLPGARGDRGELARVLRRRAVRTPRHGRGLS